MLKNLAFLFWAKNGQKSGSKFKKMAQKNQIGENGGERKINPSANPRDSMVDLAESAINKITNKHVYDIITRFVLGTHAWYNITDRTFFFCVVTFSKNLTCLRVFFIYSAVPFITICRV